MQTTISILVFAVGTVIAVIGAAKLPSEGASFPNTWPWAIVGAAIAAVGIWRWRSALRRGVSLAVDEKGEPKVHPLQLIEQLQKPLRELAHKANTLNAKQLESEIDRLLENYVSPVSEQRSMLIAEMGVAKAADVLIKFSATERSLNRAWSAAGDGHLDEAVSTLRTLVDDS